MTIDQDWNGVTMWNTVQHNEIHLTNRILPKEINNLRAYLTPFLYQREQEKNADSTQKKEELKYRERIKTWVKEYKEQVEGIKAEDEDDDDEEGNESDIDLGMDDNEKKDGESIDDEFQQDDEEINPNEIIIRELNMDQYLKGDRIDQIGLKMQLGEDTQEELKVRENIDDVGGDGDDEEALAKAAASGDFFAKQKAARLKAEKSREDKHLLPQKFAAYPYCEFGDIDLIFNHKNVWANLQNSDPTKIFYHIHDDTMWLPFVRDNIYPHQWDLDGYENVEMFLKWQKFIVGQTNLEVNKQNPEWKQLHLKPVAHYLQSQLTT